LPSPFSFFLLRGVGFGEGEADGEIIGTTFGGWNFRACDSNFRVASGDADAPGEVAGDTTGVWEGRGIGESVSDTSGVGDWPFDCDVDTISKPSGNKTHFMCENSNDRRAGHRINKFL
jgi:hypothetical protein